MNIENKLGWAFGSAARFAGAIVFIAGFFFMWFAPLIILIGASLSFSFKGIKINTGKKQYKSYTAIAGIFKYGKWEDLNPMDEILINVSTDHHVTYSRSNFAVSVPEKSIHVVMQGKTIPYSVAIANCKTKKEAHEKASELSKTLNLNFVE
jgi:hypothetical protein